MSISSWLLIVVGLFGHTALWISTVNRLHGTGLRRLYVKSITAVVNAWLLLFPLGLVWLVWQAQGESAGAARLSGPLVTGYLGLCSLFALFHYPYWLWRRAKQTKDTALLSHSTRVVNISDIAAPPLIAGLRAQVCRFVPGNQLLRLHVEEKTLALPHLAPELAGLSIAHVSDLHFTGRVTRAYFDAVVDLINDLDADMIALTGDVCDKTDCVAWIEPTLGRLRSRLGAYFVLGNHDLRVDDVDGLRRTLDGAGLVDVSAVPRELDFKGQGILLAGNERPWFRRSSEPPPLLDSSQPDRHEPLRILLSHSPDQFAWAQARQFDLVLAGHTHGGQIRFPAIGPVVCPSLFGVTYAEGVFTGGDAVMHVSRGTCSMFPLRLGCPPELTRLVLVRG